MADAVRRTTDAARLKRFMADLGRSCRGGGRVYLVGGASAVLLGWRSTTVEPDTLLRLFEAIAPDLVRYPALDPPTYRRQVARAVADLRR